MVGMVGLVGSLFLVDGEKLFRGRSEKSLQETDERHMT